MLYLGMKKRIHALGHHSMFFGGDFAGAFTDIFEKRQVPDDVFFYVNAPAHTDPTMAPPGKDALYVLVPVPHQTPNIDWKTMGPLVRAKVFARLKEEGYGDLEAQVECERVITPDDWATSLNLVHGSNFGLSQNLFQVGPFRPRVYDERVQNLFFCGASAQPGTGVPTVMVSARLACEAIAKRAVLPLAVKGGGSATAAKGVAA
jgi:phytoene desaturase